MYSWSRVVQASDFYKNKMNRSCMSTQIVETRSGKIPVRRLCIKTNPKCWITHENDSKCILLRHKANMMRHFYNDIKGTCYYCLHKSIFTHFSFLDASDFGFEKTWLLWCRHHPCQLVNAHQVLVKTCKEHVFKAENMGVNSSRQKND